MIDGDVERHAACVDNVHDILGVAVSVLQDYGTEPGDSRTERMARWLVLNLGVQVHDEHGGLFALDAEKVLQLATALLICAERSEEV